MMHHFAFLIFLILLLFLHFFISCCQGYQLFFKEPSFSFVSSPQYLLTSPPSCRVHSLAQNSGLVTVFFQPLVIASPGFQLSFSISFQSCFSEGDFNIFSLSLIFCSFNKTSSHNFLFLLGSWVFILCLIYKWKLWLSDDICLHWLFLYSQLGRPCHSQVLKNSALVFLWTLF